MTMSPSPIGDAAVTKAGWVCGAGLCHTIFPLEASKQEMVPLIPSVHSFPLWNNGVALGPSPWSNVPSYISYDTGYSVRQDVSPVSALSAVIPSLPSRHVKAYTVLPT